ncbi:MAG: glucose-1-phosphate adenylyltransferase [Candidatus Omnitrophica bacterium]|nr:glucose-1-phosphate adenylyltransferase [Candidatus Omnitrophota bacterium]MDD5488566.1 glucose-1-phosphate adenylyltransferase [Candidatus Omnitrophota bacterium]
MHQVLCLILGGGRGTRLFPLTKERCKPAVPLFGKYRLIDIPVSNCLNSDFNRIYILTQFLSESLNKHISRTYKMDAFTKGYIEVMAAEQSMDDTDWFQGTADAVRRCLKHFNNPDIKYILVLSGDQLYKMDLAEMYRYHVSKKAELTVACNRVSPDEVSGLGIMGVDKDARITRFVEKPKDVSKISDMEIKNFGEKCFLGSMGIYLFNKKALIELLVDQKKVDFGKEIIPDAIHTKLTYAYTFDGYWRDIGTIKGFYEENLLLTGAMPPMDMFDEKWQIFTRARFLPPAKFTDSQVDGSIVAEGAILISAIIKHSIIGLRFRVGAGSKIDSTIAMGCDYYETMEQLDDDKAEGIPHLGVGADCEIRKAILDKNVRIGDNVKIINSRNLDNFDGPNYHIRDGIVIISKNSVIPSGTVI